MTSTAARLAAALAALAAALFLSGCTSAASAGHADRQHTDEPAITGTPAGYNADDVAFTTNMIPPHQQPVAISGLFTDRTAKHELIALSNQTAAAQQPEIETMKVFLGQWKENPDTNSGHGGHGQAMAGMLDEPTMTKLQSLNGAEFD